MRTMYPFTCLSCGTRGLGYRRSAKCCNASCQLKHEYKTGVRDPNTIATAAQERIRQIGQPKYKGKAIPHLHNTANFDKVSQTKLLIHAQRRQRDGVPEPKRVYNTRKWRAWRKAVFERDNYTCALCGDAKGGNLQADHIRPRYWYPELTYVVANGRTLCFPCHKATPTYGHKVHRLKREQ